MEETESLSSILSGKGETAAPPAAEAATTTTAEPTAKAEASPTRDESGRFVKTEATKEPAKEPPKEAVTEPAKEEHDGRNVALAAARERYRKAEARLKELESSKTPAEKVSIFENEDEGIRQRLDEHTRPYREANFNMSVRLARLTYKEGFEAAEAAFFDSAEQDPRLYDQMRASSDPGEFIMTVGTQIAELAPVGGNFVAYKEKVTSELRGELTKRDEQIKLLTEQVAALQKAQTNLESIPRSLNKGNESAPRSNAEADDEDLKSIVRFGKTG